MWKTLLIHISRDEKNVDKLKIDIFSYFLPVDFSIIMLRNIGSHFMINSISEITQLWDRALKKIEDRLGDKLLFDSFFSGSYIYEIKGDTIVVAVNSTLGAVMIKSRYYDVVSDAIYELTESNFKLEFVLESDIQNNKQTVTSASKQYPYFQDAVINQSLTFENFVVGDFNREASQAALMIASKPGMMFNPLFIYSNSGLGKTHLLHAIGNYVQKVSKPGAKVLYIQAMEFIDEYVKYVRGEKDSESLKDYVSGFDVLLFDDVQFLAEKVRTEDMFFSIFENMSNHGKQIVITSDRQPSELSGLEERLVTRFSRGLTVKINEPDKNTCVEILRKKIVANGLDISRFDDAVLVFFADKYSTNLRELEGALNRLIFYTINMKHIDYVTLDDAVEAVGSISGSKTVATELSETKIINVVADYYNLVPSQLTGKIRTGQIALARHIAMYLIRNKLDVSLKKIGVIFGGKDHTTVMSAITKVDKELKTDEDLKTAIAELEKRLKI